MYYNSMFQQTLIDSLLYERRKNIDKIACSDNIQPEDFDTITNCINSIPLDDPAVEKLLEQTEINMNLILDGSISGFTNDDVVAVTKIKEHLQDIKERFSIYKEDRSVRERELKDEFSYKSGLPWKIIRHINMDDLDFQSRYKTYVKFKEDIEEPLAAITLRKWENQLTKPNEYQRGNKFKFLVHAINPNTDIDFVLQQSRSVPIISTSLITDQFQGTYRNSKFGFVYQPNLNNVLLICNSDCFVNYSSDFPFKAGIFSLTDMPLAPDKLLKCSYIKTCKTMHIEEIENDSKDYQKHSIEDISNYELYNEIVLLNDPSTNPVAVFLLETEDTSDCMVDRAEKLATKLNLPLLRI